jgi:hypothetical protein
MWRLEFTTGGRDVKKKKKFIIELDTCEITALALFTVWRWHFCVSVTSSLDGHLVVAPPAAAELPS